MTERLRGLIYRYLTTTIVPGLIGAGWLTEKQWLLVAGIITAWLGNGLAAKHTSIEKKEQ